jgi:transcriptional regulator with XRE-family HTH domain
LHKFLGYVEKGKANPSARILIRLAHALEVPVGELFETSSYLLPYRLAAGDAKDISTALVRLTTLWDRVRARQLVPFRSALSVGLVAEGLGL